MYKLKSFINDNENIIVVSLVMLSIVSVIFFGTSKSSYDIKRTLRYSFTLQNKTNKVLNDVDFWVYAPVKQTSNQKTDTVTASHDYELTEDELGNQVLLFKIDQFAPYASKIIKLETKLHLSTKPINQAIQNKAVFLQAEKYVEVDNERIKQVGIDLKAADQLSSAQSVMNWVHKNIKYAGYIEKDRGALYALKSRLGDCTEYMYLFTAVMRSLGMPVRNIGGYVYSENTVLQRMQKMVM